MGTAAFVDVRDPYEFEARHVAGAINVPIGRFKAHVDGLPRHVEVVVTCQIGQRSGLAVRYLRERGFDAHNLDGGLEAWIAAGCPLEASGMEGGRVVDGWARDLDGNRFTPAPGD